MFYADLLWPPVIVLTFSCQRLYGWCNYLWRVVPERELADQKCFIWDLCPAQECIKSLNSSRKTCFFLFFKLMRIIFPWMSFDALKAGNRLKIACLIENVQYWWWYTHMYYCQFTKLLQQMHELQVHSVVTMSCMHAHKSRALWANSWLCACVHTHTHTHAHTRVHMHTHTYTHTHGFILCSWMCMYMLSHVCMMSHFY